MSSVDSAKKKKKSYEVTRNTCTFQMSKYKTLLFAINSADAYLSFPGDTYFFPTESIFTKLIITSPLHPYSLNY